MFDPIDVGVILMYDVGNESNFIVALFVIAKYWKLYVLSKCRFIELWCTHVHTYTHRY